MIGIRTLRLRILRIDIFMMLHYRLFSELWVAPPDGSPIQEYASENATNTPGLNYYVNSSDFGIIRQHAFNMEQKNLPRGRGNLTCEGAAK